MRGAYFINEIFYSLQGEGVRAGTPNVFLRFSGCNLQCNGVDVAQAGEAVFQPLCDTEFASSRPLSVGEILQAANELWPVDRSGKAVIFTGGEPALQLDADLLQAFKDDGWFCAIETNGTKPLPAGLNWVTVSPKTAEHTLKVRTANEVKYVRATGQALPRPTVAAEHFLISPHVQPDGSIRLEDMQACVALVKQNPQWRLSVQQHKFWRVR